MHMITYFSEATVVPGIFKLELQHILSSARKRNSQLGITGVLFVRGNTFFQTIEGPTDAVNDVFQDILADDRHDKIYVLINEPIEKQRFSGWPMECFHNPDYDKDYLSVFHEIGKHFCKETSFCPSAIYSFCWRLVADLAVNRLSNSPTVIPPKNGCVEN